MAVESGDQQVGPNPEVVAWYESHPPWWYQLPPLNHFVVNLQQLPGFGGYPPGPTGYRVVPRPEWLAFQVWRYPPLEKYIQAGDQEAVKIVLVEFVQRFGVPSASITAGAEAQWGLM